MIAALDPYELLVVAVGVGAMLAAIVPSIVRDKPLSLPIVLVAFGAVSYWLIDGLVAPDPAEQLELTERLTEMGVLVSLMGAGLAIDRPIGWKQWATTWRLLAITMPIGIVATTVLGVAALQLPLASALLLGAVLAPTDPVLAGAVKVGEPAEQADPDADDNDSDDNVRVALTSEAGLNDALAFPFVYAAIAFAAESTDAGGVAEWFAVDVVYRIAIGVVVGAAIGWVLQRLAFAPPRRFVKLADLSQGFVALSTMFLAYGVAEIASGYGFLAVFAAAVTLRQAERHHEYHRVLHDFVEQFERIIVVVLLVLFGGSLVGGLLDGFTATALVVAIILVVLVRPAAGAIGLLGARETKSERFTIAFFGIKGIGSLYYLAYALSSEQFEAADTLWAVVAVTIIASLVIHGVAATPVLNWVDGRRTHPKQADEVNS